MPIPLLVVGAAAVESLYRECHVEAAAARARLAGRTKRNRARRRLGRREGGAALVEFALIAPVLFLVLFGVIEFGMALNDYQSIRHGVRDGARQAAVQQYGSTPTTCTSATDSSDVAAPADVKKVICLTEDRIGLGGDVRVLVEFTKASNSGGDYGSISVCAQRNVDPFTGAIPMIDGISLKSSIEMRMEDDLPSGIFATGDPAGTKKVYSESLDTGQDWSGC